MNAGTSPTANPAWRALHADGASLSWRTLEGVVPGRADAVDAYCPERGNVRSFPLRRMLAVVDAATGRAVDPHAFLQSHGRPGGEPLGAVAWHARLPVSALLSFAAATCGTDRARPHVVAAAKALVGEGIDGVDGVALAAWVDRQWHVSAVQLLRGDTHAYDTLLAAVPPATRAACLTHAVAIAGEASDAAESAAWTSRAIRDFPPVDRA